MSTGTVTRADAMSAFLSEVRWGDAKREPIPGDASSRRYIRLRRGEKTAMLMDQPQNAEAPAAAPDASPETRRALGYNALARLAGADCGRFVAVARHLKKCGLGAPEIYAADLKNGFLIIEDLGDDLYTDVLNGGASEKELYASAIDALVRLHADGAPQWLAPDKPLFVYDETALLAEIELLTEWFLPAALSRPIDEALAGEHRDLWRKALRKTSFGPPMFVHRDYHAQNLLWRGGLEGIARVGVIDFQDAVAGSPAYDLVSLLEDARRDVHPDLAESMTARYLEESNATPADAEVFRAAAALLAAQRNAKIIGIFARLAKRDHKPRYLAHLPRVWRYMEKDLSHPELRELRTWYDANVPARLRGALQGAAA
jgi:aminoglycoside/choline kinase family phosphotransferase